jgi:cytochrome c peroxidase
MEPKYSRSTNDLQYDDFLKTPPMELQDQSRHGIDIFQLEVMSPCHLNSSLQAVRLLLQARRVHFWA